MGPEWIVGGTLGVLLLFLISAGMVWAARAKVGAAEIRAERSDRALIEGRLADESRRLENLLRASNALVEAYQRRATRVGVPVSDAEFIGLYGDFARAAREAGAADGATEPAGGPDSDLT